MSCQPSGCRMALRKVPSSANPALAATRQEAGLAVEWSRKSRCSPSSSTAQRATATVAAVATPRPRAAGRTQ
jgi:hypothetical protein